jgi:hypothetical protein
MKLVSWLARAVWSAAVAYLPVALWKLQKALASDLGCPPAGDCYVPGSEHFLQFDLLILAAAVLLWPVCIWVAVIAPALSLSGHSKPQRHET